MTTKAKDEKKKRATGHLEKPRMMIHRGKFTVEVPAVMREVIDNDEESETFGSVREEEAKPAEKVSGDLPKGSRFGSRRVRTVYEITDAGEAELLEARGFVDANEAEIERWKKSDKSTMADEIARRDRERAHARAKKMTGRGAARNEEDEE